MVKQKVKDAKWKWWERRHKNVLDKISHAESQDTVEAIKEELPFTIPSPIGSAAAINAMYAARGVVQTDILYQNQMLAAQGQQAAFNQSLMNQQQQFQAMLGQQSLLNNPYGGSDCGDSLGLSGIISVDYGKK